MRHPDERTPDARPGESGGGGAWHADEGMIHAWLDDALSPAEAAALERHVATCLDCRAAVAEARGLVAASSRILSALDDVPEGVLPAATPPAATPPAATPPAAGPGAVAGAAAGGAGAAVDGGRDDVRPIRPAAAPASRPVRRWRLPAIAAVALLAVGTTVVLRQAGDVSFEAAQDRAAATTASGAAEEAPTRASGPSPLAVPPVAAPPVAPNGEDAAPQEAQDQRRSNAAGSARERAPQEEAARAADAAAKAAPAATEPAPPASLALIAPIVPPVLPPTPPGARSDEVRLRAAPSMALAPAGRPESEARGVTGRVVVAGSGAPLPGATVTVPSLGRSAVSDSAGRFALGVLPPGSHPTLVRRIGYAPGRLELAVRDTAAPPPMEVALRPVPVTLEGVVTTGVAESRRDAAAQVAPERVTTLSGVTAAGAAAGAAPLAGCYGLEVGGGSPADRRLVERTLPGILWLLPSPTDGPPGWREATSGASRGAQPVPGARWRTTAGDSVQVVWSAGETPLQLLLRSGPEGLVGTVERTGEGVGRGAELNVEITARRRSCPGS